MSTATLHAEVETILAAATTLSSWASTHFNKALTVLHGVREIERIDINELPALIIAMGQGTNEPLALGVGAPQKGDEDVLMGIVFQKDDPDAAYAAILELPDIFINIFKANPTLNDAVGGCWITDWVPGGGAGNRYGFNATLLTDRET